MIFVAASTAGLSWLQTAILGGIVTVAGFLVQQFIKGAVAASKEHAEAAVKRCEELMQKTTADLARVDALDIEQTGRIDKLETADVNIQQTYARLSGDLDRRILVYVERVEACERETSAAHLHAVQALQSAQQTERTCLAMLTGAPPPVPTMEPTPTEEESHDADPAPDAAAHPPG